MAFDIKVKGDREPLRIEDHEKGLKIKNAWVSLKLGKGTDSVIEVSGWTGTLSDIRDFREVTNVSRASRFQVEYEELTPEQHEKARKHIAIIRKEMREKGIFKKSF